MDLTQLSDEELQTLANIGNFAAMGELARRSNPGNTLSEMSAIDRVDTNEAIRRNIELDRQGDVRTFDIPKDNIDMDAYSDSELMESDTTSPKGILQLLTEGGGRLLDYIGGGGIIGNALDFLGDQFQYRGAGPSITNTPLAQYAFRDELRRDPNFDIAAALDKQNARGGYYSDFARGQRQLAGRFSNLMDRARSGNFSRGQARNLLGISNALGMGVTQDDINNIVSGAYNLNTGDGPSGAGTFTAKSLSDGFAGEEGPVGGGLGSFGTSTNDASTFSDYS
jgi:hypothetical protein